ncbi:hypothetical protein GBA52_011945 [Prunus armeniaca]|nr:hypothetical protein GBA52_011945 [Prunus armeniaca]
MADHDHNHHHHHQHRPPASHSLNAPPPSPFPCRFPHHPTPRLDNTLFTPFSSSSTPIATPSKHRLSSLNPPTIQPPTTISRSPLFHFSSSLLPLSSLTLFPPSPVSLPVFPANLSLAPSSSSSSSSKDPFHQKQNQPIFSFTPDHAIPAQTLGRQIDSSRRRLPASFQALRMCPAARPPLILLELSRLVATPVSWPRGWDFQISRVAVRISSSKCFSVFEAEGDGVSIGNLAWPLANTVVFGVLLSESYGDDKSVSSKDFRKEYLMPVTCCLIVLPWQLGYMLRIFHVCLRIINLIMVVGDLRFFPGYTNAVFLVLVGALIVLESFERILDPQEISTSSLLVVSIGGLLVNVVGLVFFHEEHHHAHGGSGSCSHSHPHQHSHGSVGHDHGGHGKHEESIPISIECHENSCSGHDDHHEHQHGSYIGSKDHNFGSNECHDHDGHSRESVGHDHGGHGKHEESIPISIECHENSCSGHDDHHEHQHGSYIGSKDHNFGSNECHDHDGQSHQHDHHGHSHQHDHHGHSHQHDHHGHSHQHDHHGQSHQHEHHDHARQHEHHDHARQHTHSSEGNKVAESHIQGAGFPLKKLPTDGEKTAKHQHHHIDHNMEGIFLHVLADTLGSVGVVISTVLIKYKGWLVADPACSIFISVLIISSVIPLLRNSAEILLQRVPRAHEQDLRKALIDVSKIRGISGIRNLHIWNLTNSEVVGTLHLHVSTDIDKASAKAQVSHVLYEAGIKDLTLQLECVGQ